MKKDKYYEFNENDIIITTATDSMEMYQSRIQEYRDKNGDYTDAQAAVDYGKCIEGVGIDNMLELSYYDRRRMHNLKYFTWIEQQGKEIQELNDQWYDEDYWSQRLTNYKKLDDKINEFNDRTGLLKKYS